MEAIARSSECPVSNERYLYPREIPSRIFRAQLPSTTRGYHILAGAHGPAQVCVSSLSIENAITSVNEFSECHRNQNDFMDYPKRPPGRNQGCTLRRDLSSLPAMRSNLAPILLSLRSPPPPTRNEKRETRMLS